jgi:5'-3' exonuclease
MGVHDLYKLIKESGAYAETHVSIFKGMTIPIDISTYLYRYKCVKADNWPALMTPFLNSFIDAKTHPIVVIDGPPTRLKEKEKKRREDDKKKKGNNISKMRNDYNEGKISDSVRDKIVKSRGLLAQRNKKKSPVNLKDFKQYIDKQENQNITITDDDIKTLIELRTELGVKYIKSPCEAETLVMKFVEAGHAIVVASEDSDCFAYRGAKYVISSLDTHGNCNLISFKDVLQLTGLDEKQFVDFCILSGTDYSKYEGIAGKTALKLVHKYNCIEEYEKTLTKASGVDFVGIRDLYCNFCGIKNEIFKNLQV